MQKNKAIPIFLLISLSIGLFIVFPTAKATGTQQIVNGGFETDVFSPWINQDSETGAIFNATQETMGYSYVTPHNGTYYCYLGFSGLGGSINQTTSSIPQGSIENFSLYAYDDNSIASFPLIITIYYADGTTTWNINGMSNHVWALYDIVPHLNASKGNIEGLNIVGFYVAIDDVSLTLTTSSHYALTVNSNINSYFTMNGSILSTEFGAITPYSNVSVPEAYYAFTRLNSSLGAYNFSHWYVLFTDNGSQVTINSTSTFIIINLNANLTVWLIYASTSIVTLPEFHIPFLVPLLIQILDLLFSFGAMGYLYRESRSAKTGLRAFILIMLIFMLMITIFLAANVLYGFG